MKRIDWDPKGERNTQNRGKSGYERISWDEAAQIVADELLRVKEKYGMSAVLAEADMHGEGKHVAPCHGCMNRLLSMLGGYTVQMRNMDSWEGWAWGAKNVWGGEPFGEMQPTATFTPISARTRSCCSSGAATRKPRRWAWTGTWRPASASFSRSSE
jgi:trimethylamine-N-oxide reductase (cytochrome c)